MAVVVLAVVLALVAVVVAAGLRRRIHPAPLTSPTWSVPQLVDRGDFERPEAEWLVAAFTSATCDTCAGVVERAAVLASADVVVDNVEATAKKWLHQRYRIDAVPLVLVVDRSGVVRSHFLGPVRATDLWGALAELRAPGSVPDSCPAHGDHSAETG